MSNDKLIEFIEEANRLLSESLASLNDPSSMESPKETINSVFRTVHTIKGTAVFFNLPNIKTVSHKIESLLEKFRNRDGNIDASVLNHIKRLLTDFKSAVHLSNVKSGAYLSEIAMLSKRVDATAKMLGFPNYFSGNTVAEGAKSNHRDIKKLIKNATLVELKGYAERIRHNNPRLRIELANYYKLAKQLESRFENVHDKIFTLSFSIRALIEYLLSEDSREKSEITILLELADLLNSTISLELMDINDMNMDISDAVQKLKKTLTLKGAKIDLTPIAPVANLAFNQFNKQQFSVRVQPEKLSEISLVLSDLDRFHDELTTTVSMHNDLSEEIKTELDKFLFESATARKDLKKLLAGLNKVPLIALFQRLHILIQQVSKQLRKDIRLEYLGEDIQLDKDIIESLKDCLSHLVRNSCDHGIESVEERAKKHKSAYGTIHIGAFEALGNLHIQFKDDGRGINVEKLKKKLIQRGDVSEKQLSTMTQEEIIAYILRPGVSTADNVTDLSGRGVGLDVLNFYVKKLNGSVGVVSETGNFTEFNITIPLSS